jgi:predicted RNA-binding Zn-ribbon protein involved in translation (DUF1610 family)
MSAEAVELGSKRPHVAGTAFCLDCKHEWGAAAPVGVTWMECPACGLERGRFKFSCQRDGLEWRCNCGNDLFHMKPAGIYCPNCGEWQQGF